MPNNIGAFGENLPYTNFHNLNMDWIIKTLKEINDKLDTATESKIKIADPPIWDITKPYEPLTVVFYGNTAYLSIKPVPAGILISNTEYWTPIFSLTTLYEMIEDLKEEIEDEYQKKESTKQILFCGDSYTLWNSSRLYNKFVSLLPISPTQCTNLAVSGASFYNQSNSFVSQIMNYTGDKTLITDIIVAGGINDAIPAYGSYDRTYPNISNLTNAMQTFINYANTHYPNAKVHLAYIGGCMPDSEYYATEHPAKAQEMAFYAYTVEGAMMGYNILAGYNTIHMTKDYYSADKLHPNTSGADAIATTLAKSFLGDTVVEVRPVITTPIETASGVSTSVSLPFQYRIVNDIVEMTINTGYWFIEEDSELGATATEVSSMSDTQIQIKCDVCVPCTFLLGDFEGITGRHPVPGTLIFRNGKIYIELYELDGSTWKTFVAESGANITVEGIHLTTSTFNIN